MSQFDSSLIDCLSMREREVLTLLASGNTVRQAAETLSLAEKTVKNHATNIYKALGVNSRAQATLVAVKAGLIQL